MIDDLTVTNVTQTLLQRVPEFRQEVDDHIHYYDEIIPYVLWGGFVPFVDAVCNQWIVEHDEAALGLLKRFSAFLEDCANSSDANLINLIQVGFLEVLPHLGDRYSHFVSLLESNTLHLLNEVNAGWDKLG